MEDNDNKFSDLVKTIQEELDRFCDEHKRVRTKYVDIINGSIVITIVIILPDYSTKCYRTTLFNSETAFKRLIEFEHNVSVEME